MSKDRAAAASAVAVGQQADQVVVAGRRRRGRRGWRSGRARPGVRRACTARARRASAALAATRTGTACSSSSARERRVDVARPEGRPEAPVGGPHLGEVLPGQARRRPRRTADLVHGCDHVACVAHRAQVEGGHRGRATRAGLHQARRPPRRSRASRTGVRLTPSQSASSRSRSCSPGANVPSTMASRSRANTSSRSSARGTGAAATGMGMQYIASCRDRRHASRPRGDMASRLRG